MKDMTPQEKLAAVGEIERDESMDRTYIPVAPGWEVQTKGSGSTFRIAEPDGSRLPIPDSPYLHETLERMARAVNAHVKALESLLSEHGGGGEAVAWFPTNSNGEILRNYGDGSPVFASRTREEAEQAKRCHLGATGPVVPLYLRPFASSAPTLARTAAEKEWSEWSDRLRKLIGDRTEVLHFAADVQATDDGVRFDNCRFVHAPTPPTPSAPVVDDAMVREVVERHVGKTSRVAKYITDDLTAALSGVSAPVVDETVQDACDDILHKLEGWAEAYPECAFGPVTDAEREKHGSLISRASASMGRHIARVIEGDIAKLRAALSGVSAPMGADELLRDARMVLDMNRTNAEFRAGKPRRPWDGKFLANETDRVISAIDAALTPPAAAPRGEEPTLAQIDLAVRSLPPGYAFADAVEHASPERVVSPAASEDGLNDDLLPCPFCGGGGSLDEDAGAWAVACTVCGIEQRWYTGGKADAITAWDTRRLAASGQGVEWQPIETAPKDGTGVLGFISESWIEGIFWNEEEWSYLSDGDITSHGRLQPTHWMPLPAAPTQEKGNG